MRLELGITAGAVALARLAGARLSRGEYQDLVKAGLNTPEAIDGAAEDVLLACVGGEMDKAQAVRDAAAAIRSEPEPAKVPVLPAYED